MRKVTIFFLAVSCLIIIGSSIAFTMDNRDISDFIFRYGQIEKEYIDSISSSDIFFENDDFVIYESEIKMSEEQRKLMGQANAREHIIRDILRREILYSEALKRGFTADHEEVEDMINDFTENVPLSENYEKDIIPFLSGRGMTNEEYWKTQYDIFKRNIIMTKYYAALNEIMREDLYNEALGKGFTADHEEIMGKILYNTELTRSSPYYETTANNLGMTHEEYWESRYDDIKYEIVISKYLTAQGESIDDNSMLSLTQTANRNRVINYTRKLVDDYIKANDITF